MNRPKFYVYLPIAFALVLVLGIFIGSKFLSVQSINSLESSSQSKFGKLEGVLRYIYHEYVDTISDNDLVESTIISMLENLDPHSSYIPAEEMQANNEPLQGNFEGIGVEFNIVDDTVRVVAAISGGPAEQVGVQAGDKIVLVDGISIAGVKIDNKGVMSKLKGKGGTKVKISVKRNSKNKLIDFSITRGTIPIHSVDVSYMLNSMIGYIKISRFAATTYDEFIAALDKLQKQGMQKLVIDLRGNGGGYLNTAVDIADELLANGKQIVYTEGKARPRKNYIATSKGNFENGELIILIDDGSASASEILAGAIQDNDRGTILGRRSFGKGLVQEQNEFTDGSGLRLTIARYYTPTGRCIQKPYHGKNDEYYEEEYTRYKNGELESADSIKVADSLKYTTPAGKIVYGGGGIIPDVFVAVDTTGRTMYLGELFYAGVMNDFTFNYADKNREKLKEYKSSDNFRKNFTVTPQLISELVVFAEKAGVKKNDVQLKQSENIIKNQLKALIARNVWNTEAYYPIMNDRDVIVKKAMELLEKKKSN
ncbi:MAG: S41 family peptidase [Bacteroidia bacterium]|nr:S41 family peptidase [Bacteroidia bacterium]